MREVARLVFHAAAAGDIKPQVEVLKAPQLAQFKLFEHAVGADAEIGASRVITAVDGRESAIGAVHDGYPDDFVLQSIGHFEGVTAGGYQEIPIPVLVNRRLSVSETAFVLVLVVKPDAPLFDDRRPNAHAEHFIPSLEESLLCAREAVFCGRESDGLTGGAGGTSGPVEHESLAPITALEASP